MRCRLWASSCFFLLVTPLSRRHLALAALPTRSSSEEGSSAAYSVAWSSPASGDRFGPGDTIVGEWQATPDRVVSPSFRLCVGGEDGCGATVWPKVEESDGSYHVSMTAPSVTTESGYYLQMKDDFGHTYSSPIFNITPTPQEKNKPAAHSPGVAQPRPDQAPMSSSSSSSSSSSTGTKSEGAGTDSNPATPAVALPAAPAPANPNGTLSAPSAASISPNTVATSSPGSGPQVAAAHNAPPTAALAVPLSLAGAIILLAGGLAMHHRRRLAAEKERAWTRSRDDASESALLRRMRSHSAGLALNLGGGNRSNSRGGSHHDDVEKALFTRALFRGEALPDHVHDSYHDRRLTQKAMTAAADPLYSYTPPSYAYGAPQPRQRTRELNLLTREFTAAAAAARPRTYPSSPSSDHGLWGRRHSVWRNTSSNNGGGSLWRSLSFVPRHKVVAPVAPPSDLNSPTMTAVASVTSEVLPSYLPSPNFVGAAADQARGGEHGAGVADFGFENVPLSPPLPSPLHTRREAADPDDLRMRELRGVYEAVARALGSVHRV